MAPEGGLAPGSAALIGQWLPGPGRHQSRVQTKKALKEIATTRATPRAAGPACWPHERRHHPAAPAHVGLGSGQVPSPSSPRRAALTSALVALLPSAFWASAPRQLPSSHSHRSLPLPRVPPLSPVVPPHRLVTAPFPPQDPPLLTPPNP